MSLVTTEVSGRTIDPKTATESEFQEFLIRNGSLYRCGCRTHHPTLRRRKLPYKRQCASIAKYQLYRERYQEHAQDDSCWFYRFGYKTPLRCNIVSNSLFDFRIPEKEYDSEDDWGASGSTEDRLSYYELFDSSLSDAIADLTTDGGHFRTPHLNKILPLWYAKLGSYRTKWGASVLELAKSHGVDIKVGYTPHCIYHLPGGIDVAVTSNLGDTKIELPQPDGRYGRYAEYDRQIYGPYLFAWASSVRRGTGICVFPIFTNGEVIALADSGLERRFCAWVVASGLHIRKPQVKYMREQKGRMWSELTERRFRPDYEISNGKDLWLCEVGGSRDKKYVSQFKTKLTMFREAAKYWDHKIAEVWWHRRKSRFQVRGTLPLLDLHA
ncbi:hypothetical protein [Nibricoccus sp. IMCC34717]|uniref:hypothetical protein n=1 Tax=Nibricoccus sp. IMCC34717 TaxID=3034021 RepID=UPI00384DDECD